MLKSVVGPHFAPIHVAYRESVGGQQEGICPSYHHTHPGHVVSGGATEFVAWRNTACTNVITVRAGISDPTTSTIRITTQTASKATHLEIKAMIVWLCDHPGAYEKTCC